MGAEETQNRLLQLIAAAAVPHKLGNLYSRYGEPAPVLGRSRPGMSTAGRPGSSQQDDERFSKYEDLPDPADERAARDEQADAAGDADYMKSLGNLQDYAQSIGVGSDELEDMKDTAPDLTEDEAKQYLSDKASSPHPMTWEDWLDQRKAEKESGDPRYGTRPVP